MTNPLRRVTRRDSLRVWNCEITGLPKGIAKTISDGGILPGFLKCLDIKEDGTLVFEYTAGPDPSRKVLEEAWEAYKNNQAAKMIRIIKEAVDDEHR